MAFKDLDTAWADFKAETKITELVGDNAAADRYLRIIFGAGAVAGMSVVADHVAAGDDTISLTLLIAQIMQASDLIHADLKRITADETRPASDDRTLSILERIGRASMLHEQSAFTVRNPDMEATQRKLGHVIVDAIPSGWGFALFLFEFAPGDTLFYISNAQRADMLKTCAEFIRRNTQ